MKSIEFRKEKYDCPESWSDCTLGMMIQTQTLNEVLPNAPIIAVIGGYVGIPTQELAAASVKEIQPFLDTLDFIDKEYQPRSTNSFEFEDKVYSCPQNLTEVRFDQWVSAQTVIYNYRENPVKGLPKMLASLCMLSGETINDINLGERGDLFLTLPYTTAKDIEGFFLESKLELEAISQLSSIIDEQEKLIPKQLTEVLSILSKRKAQPTTSWRTKRWIGIYQNYLKSFQKNWDKSYNSLPTKG